MKLIDFKSLNLTIEESRDLIKFLAQRRGVSIKKLLSTIKPSLRHKNNKDLTAKSQQKLAKSQRELRKTQHGLIKSIKSQQEPIIPQQTLSNIKERIEVIRKKLNELRNNFSKMN